MKTIAQLRSAYDLSDATDFAISEVQRDAREGMVDAYDVIILTANLEDFIRQYGQHIEALRAKHPELFPK